MKGLTEHEIIRILTNQFYGRPGVPLGFDDDVSAIPLSSENWIIVKTDMLVGSTDVPPGMTVRQAARKAVVATVSDFAAKGVRPRALLVSLGLPAPAKRTTVQDIARGLSQAAREYNCKIIGGDTNQAEDLIIDVIGIGLANPKKLVRRSGAQPGDVVAVTGPFGKSSAGLRILMSRNKKNRASYPSLVRAALWPRARLQEGLALARSDGINSSVDSSDGLALSLHQLAETSNVGISLDAIPIDPAVRRFAYEFRFSAIELALYGGEEYELVLTTSPGRFLALQNRVQSLIKIGTVESVNRGLTAKIGGNLFQIEDRGWEHFT
jgi:thiamine-monophosphate kinase